jgi:4'-phosphopantetheinyl transferase
MLYFIRRSFELDNDKALHKKNLRNSVYKVLSDSLKEQNIEFNRESVYYGEHGKPYLNESDLFFNISHCNGLAVCAVEPFETGVDAENIRKYPSGALKRAFSEREKEIVLSHENPDEMFFRIWTLKESFVKAIGIGVSYPLNTAEFIISGNEIISVGSDGYSFVQFMINHEFVCSLCVKKKAENKTFEIKTDKDFFSWSN